MFDCEPLYIDPFGTIARATYIAVVITGLLYGVSAWAMSVATGPDQIVDAATTHGGSIFELAVCPSLNTAASSGTSSSHSNVGLPLSSSIAHRPVRTE